MVVGFKSVQNLRRSFDEDAKSHEHYHVPSSWSANAYHEANGAILDALSAARRSFSAGFDDDDEVVPEPMTPGRFGNSKYGLQHSPEIPASAFSSVLPRRRVTVALDGPATNRRPFVEDTTSTPAPGLPPVPSSREGQLTSHASFRILSKKASVREKSDGEPSLACEQASVSVPSAAEKSHSSCVPQGKRPGPKTSESGSHLLEVVTTNPTGSAGDISEPWKAKAEDFLAAGHTMTWRVVFGTALVLSLCLLMPLHAQLFDRMGRKAISPVYSVCKPCAESSCPANMACVFPPLPHASNHGLCDRLVVCIRGYVWKHASCECSPSPSEAWLYMQPCPDGYVWSSTRSVCERNQSEECSAVPCDEWSTWNGKMCACVPNRPRCVSTGHCPVGQSWNAAVCSCIETTPSCGVTLECPAGESWDPVLCDCLPQ